MSRTKTSSLCSKCNLSIDDDDFCLKYTRNSPIEAKIIMNALTTGKCGEYIPIQKPNGKQGEE